VAGEWTENEIRKDFTPSERVAIALAIEKQMPERRGKCQNFATFNGRTDQIASKRAGFGNRETYRQAMKVVANGSSKLILAMDEDRVSIFAASLLADADSIEQNAVLELDEKAILKAAKEIYRCTGCGVLRFYALEPDED
jgi:ParB family chromosome partitioning protein